MRKLLITLLVIGLVIVGGLWWLLSDANRFKPELVELIRTNTGLQISVAGNLAWRLWPPVQLVAEGVSADWSNAGDAPMLEARAVRLDADLWPLLGKNSKLVIQGIVVDGLHARLVQTGDHANWMPPGQTGAVVPPIPIPPPAADPSAPWEVEGLAISDAVIDYVVDGDATQISIDALHISGIAPGQAFPFHAKLTISDDHAIIPLTVAAQLSVDAAVTQWQIRAIDIDGNFIQGGESHVPFQITADAELNSIAGTFTANAVALQFGKLTATLDVAATNLLTEPRYTGHINVPQQRLDSIAMLLGTPIDESVGLKAAFLATDARVDLSDLELRYGDSLVTGTFGIPIAPQKQFEFDLKADHFTIPTPQPPVAVLGGGSFAVLAFAAPATNVDPSLDEPLLPLELLRTNDWQGKLAVDQLIYDGATFNKTSIESTNTGGAIDATIDWPEFFGGSATTILKVDTRSAAPQWRVTPKLLNVDSTALLTWLDKPFDWVARLNADGELDMQGNTPHELTSSISGHMNLNGGQGILNIAEIKRQALAVAAIAGGGELVNAWPERLQYQRFIGIWNSNGTTQNLDIALDNLTLRANGKLDTAASDMDMTVTITVTDEPKYNSFKVRPLLTGLPLPLRCRGSLDAPVCSADDAGIRNLVAQALSGNNPEMAAKLDQAIDEKVPAQYRDAARSLLELLNKGAQQPKPPKSP